MKKDKPHHCFFNNKAFGLAVQALVFMSDNPNRHPSTHIAEHLCSEATLIRRIMARLAQENFVEVREGRDGGYRMKRPPETVTLADIYLCLQTDLPLCEGMMDSTGDHAWGLRMQEAFSDVAEEMNRSILEILSKRTIADLVGKINA
jgi:Rrf2 family protein